jgi:hypothetical protein
MLSASLSAQTILSVDINAGAGSPSATEDGFVGFNIGTGSTTGPLTATYNGLDSELTSGSVTFTLAQGTSLTDTGAFLARYRSSIALDNGDFTYSDLYSDLGIVTGTDTNGESITLGFSGLLANTTYEIKLFAYNDSETNTRTMTFADYTTGQEADSGSIVYSGSYDFATDSDNDKFATTISAVTDSEGNLLIRGTPGGNYVAVLNGFQISAIPEPSSFALLAGLLCFVSVASRRK